MTKEKLLEALRKRGIFTTLDDPLLQSGMVFDALLTQALTSFDAADKAAAERIRLACISGLDEAKKVGIRQAQVAIDQAATRMKSAGNEITAMMIGEFQEERKRADRAGKLALRAAMVSAGAAVVSIAGLVGVLLAG